MVYAESSKDYCIALICPNHGMIKTLASDMGIGETDIEKLCAHKEVVACCKDDSGAAKEHCHL